MRSITLALACLFLAFASACSPSKPAQANAKKTIAVSYSLLASLVHELADGELTVFEIIPNGDDPHEWEPSAQLVERILSADLVVENGLNLEGGLSKTFDRAREKGIPFFTASAHANIRTVKPGEGIPSDDEDQQPGAQDPHLWLDLDSMKSTVVALANEIRTRFQIDLTARSNSVVAKLDELKKRSFDAVQTVAPEHRKLVTGHESLGYFAERFGFKLVGAIVPSLTSEGSVSARDMADLKKAIVAEGVKVVFTELGTNPQVAQALAQEAKVRSVEIVTHHLPEGGTYFTFYDQLVQTIVANLR